MPFSWNAIKTRAIAFSKEWEHESSEDAEAKSSWDGFFEVFGVHRRRIASFEVPVKRNDAAYGKRVFKTDAERVAFLFERYQQLTSLLPTAKAKLPRKRKAQAATP